MKTLVIHPFDVTTHFLKPIYANHSDWVVMDCSISKGKIRQLIKEYDRIIMLGHGSEDGLFDFEHKRMIIDSDYVQLLREKDCICIWCNANEFVEKYKLTCSLYSGMIISDVDEAFFMGVNGTVSNLIKWVNSSNELFTKALKIGLEDDNFDLIIKLYNADENPVIDYNKKNIFIPKC